VVTRGQPWRRRWELCGVVHEGGLTPGGGWAGVEESDMTSGERRRGCALAPNAPITTIG
jgi:hypothetical protein